MGDRPSPANRRHAPGRPRRGPSKTIEGFVASHLSSEYHLQPRAAQTLCEDALVFERLWGSQTRAAGQILFHAVAIDEPAGKPLRECRMVAVRMTLRGDSGLGLPRMYSGCGGLEVEYTIGLGMNARRKRLSENTLNQAVEQFEATGEPQ